MWMEYSSEHSPTFPHRSLVLPHSLTLLFIFGHQKIFLCFRCRWLMDFVLAHICWLISSVKPAFLGISGLPLAPPGLIMSLSLSPSLLSHSLGKTKSALHRDSREHTLRFCWQRVRFFFSSPLEAGPHSVWKSGPEDTPRFSFRNET